MLNYSTTIEACKTVCEIEAILMQHGARSIWKEISEDGRIQAMSFSVETPYGELPIRLPVKVAPVFAILTQEKQKKRKSAIKATKEQAEKVAWRILKNWIEAQMALVEIEMVKMEQIFLPYAVIDASGQTVFERLECNRFLLKGEEGSLDRGKHQTADPGRI